MRSGLLVVLAVAAFGSGSVLSCGNDSAEVLFPDSGIGVGSSASTSSGGSSGNAAGAGGRSMEVADAAPPVGNSGAPCALAGDCIDADLCNGTEACIMGFCQAGTPLSCLDGDPCTADICTPSSGVCSFPRLPDGSACVDSDLCDGQTCQQGTCVAGASVNCLDDGNPCTVEACDARTGTCASVAAPAGTTCEDGDRCNGVETCASGVCVANIAPDCDDSNACTADSCDLASGCQNTTLPDGTLCSDGNLCNGVEICTLGTCLPGALPTCDDSNPCTTDVCNPATGACLFQKVGDGTPCPDGNLCDGQLCSDGHCLDGPDVACAPDNDSNVCTANVCDPALGACVRGPVPNGTLCADADLCDGTETCQAGRCSSAGIPLTCPADTNPCTTAVCDPAWGCVQNNLPNGTPCVDADLCDGAETCSNGTCSASGTPVLCDDLNPCTTNSCNPLNGGCVFTTVADGTSCADADRCDGDETCTAGICPASGTPLGCEDNNPCTSNSCVPATGCVFTPLGNGTSCSDGDQCNGAESCSSGLCTAGSPVNCDDGNPCTFNSCAPQTGTCAFSLVPDGSACADANPCDGVETCTSGVCSASGTPPVCDDNNPCTSNTCVPGSGCAFPLVPNGSLCSDGDLCNGTETCTSGFCTAGPPVSCTPPQTCNPATGSCL